MQEKINVLKTLIAEFFKEEFYNVSIANARKAIRDNSIYKDNWNDILKLILLKQIPDGKALDILFNDGHLILHENTEEGAYKWLTLMAVNLSRGDGEPILDEMEFLQP